jgi:hypothetical protein
VSGPSWILGSWVSCPNFKFRRGCGPSVFLPRHFLRVFLSRLTACRPARPSQSSDLGGCPGRRAGVCGMLVAGWPGVHCGVSGWPSAPGRCVTVPGVHMPVGFSASESAASIRPSGSLPLRLSRWLLPPGSPSRPRPGSLEGEPGQSRPGVGVVSRPRRPLLVSGQNLAYRPPQALAGAK